jgi:hypothetical protein
LTSSIPQLEVDLLVFDHDVCRVIVEDGGDIFAWEGIGGITEEQAGLSDRSITDDDALDVFHFGSEVIDGFTFSMRLVFDRDLTEGSTF